MNGKALTPDGQALDFKEFIARTAPSVMFVEICDAGHVHAEVAWVSRMPPQPLCEDTTELQIHPETGEIARPAYELTFSLN